MPMPTAPLIVEASGMGNVTVITALEVGQILAATPGTVAPPASGVSSDLNFRGRGEQDSTASNKIRRLSACTECAPNPVA